MELGNSYIPKFCTRVETRCCAAVFFGDVLIEYPCFDQMLQACCFAGDAMNMHGVVAVPPHCNVPLCSVGLPCILVADGTVWSPGLGAARGLCTVLLGLALGWLRSAIAPSPPLAFSAWK